MVSCTSNQSILARSSFMHNLSMPCCTDPFMHINFTKYQGNSICHVLESLALLLRRRTGADADVKIWTLSQMVDKSTKSWFYHNSQSAPPSIYRMDCASWYSTAWREGRFRRPASTSAANDTKKVLDGDLILFLHHS